ncbi:hypothetical protein PRZ48_010578 [Zasmidium cellare]|uniref:Lectin n=1 Tax=Zasmidium cellare TaxID=395010 RepID=A0ABR0EA03_ZASCE|nr:hypothetical protein PRZ48_010578 [Zasmidium cellare]
MGFLSKSSLEKQDYQPQQQPPPYTYAPSIQANASSSTAPYLPQASNPIMGPPTPIKSFNIVNSGFWTHKNLVIMYNGQAILHVNTKSTAAGFGSPVVRLSTDPHGSVVVAAAKCKNWSSGCKIILGNPDAAPKEAWGDVSSESWSDKQFGFYFRDRKFLWKRTHDKALGGSFWGSKDFKLVDYADQRRVLAVYVSDKKLFSGSQVGRVDFMVELGHDLELLSLAAILGIEETIRRTEGAAAGSGGGGGA